MPERHGDASAPDAVSASAPGPTSFQKSSSSPSLYLNSQEGSEPHGVTSQQVEILGLILQRALDSHPSLSTSSPSRTPEQTRAARAHLTVGRDVAEGSVIQEVLGARGVPQLGVALHIPGGELHTHGLRLGWVGRVEIMVPLKHHELFLRLGDLGWVWLKHVGITGFHDDGDLGPRIKGHWELDCEESPAEGRTRKTRDQDTEKGTAQSHSDILCQGNTTCL